MKISHNGIAETHIPDTSQAGEVSRHQEPQPNSSGRTRPAVLAGLQPKRANPKTDSQSGALARHGIASRLLGNKDAPPQRPAQAAQSVITALPTFGGWFGKKSSKSKGSSSSGHDTNASQELPMFRLRHVPYVAQGSERTGCWYACARMLGHSVEAGPRLGVPELFNPESGHSHLQHLHDVERFIANEGLSKVSLPSSREFTHEQLGALLESPRESRRLQLLREWSHEQDEQVLT
ncbi:papain-like cysteine protease family protein, partial [Ralstonia sp. SM1864_UCD524_TZ4]